jgi:hypothetical protein
MPLPRNLRELSRFRWRDGKEFDAMTSVVLPNVETQSSGPTLKGRIERTQV